MRAPWATLLTIAMILMLLGWVIGDFRYGLLIGPGWLALLMCSALVRGWLA